MTNDELQSIYLKVRRVIRSCRTMGQLHSAQQYAQLFINALPVARQRQFAENLNQALIQRRQMIRLKYGTPEIKKKKVNEGDNRRLSAIVQDGQENYTM